MFKLWLVILLCAVGINWSQENPAEIWGNPVQANLSSVRFLLWTRENHDDNDYYELVIDNEENLRNSHYKGLFRTYFMFHGYGDYGTIQWILDSKSELLESQNCNVISVDYQDLVPSPDYPQAVSNMYDVALYSASFLDWLVGITTTSTSKIHLIGHSLGAHTAGMTAEYATISKMDRITGLDPAGPLFLDKPPNQRLDKSQADFVDILHSNGCPPSEGCYGLFDPIGHVDFYPNGGSHMLGCNKVTDAADGCSHQRVTSYWTESILAGVSNYTNTFVSWPCQDWETFESDNCPECGVGCLQMGFHVQRGLEGLYYLYTNEGSPFARGISQEPPQ